MASYRNAVKLFDCRQMFAISRVLPASCTLISSNKYLGKAVKEFGRRNAQISTETSTVHSILMGPSVRNLLELYHLNNELIKASGQKGQLLKGDVLRYIKENEKVPKIFTTEPKQKSDTPILQAFNVKERHADYKIDEQRRQSAREMTHAKVMIPHAYTTTECVIDKVNKLITQMEQYNINVTVTDFVVKAAAICLARTPEMNVFWNVETETPSSKNTVDIMVQTSSYGQLLITRADEKGVKEISAIIKDGLSYSSKDMLSKNVATLTVSDLSLFDVKQFTDIIKENQVGVLALGKPYITMTTDNVVTRNLTVSLSYDARLVDDAQASKWLQEFGYLLENPLSLAF